jgi:hypothetical protein
MGMTLEEELLQAAKQKILTIASQKKRRHAGKSKDQQEIEIMDAKAAKIRKKANSIRKKMEAHGKHLAGSFIFDPYLRKINQQMLERIGTKKTGLVCPKCGGPDAGNTNNKKPWCFKCNCELIDTSQKGPVIRALSKQESRDFWLKKLYSKSTDGEENKPS